jgi:predicted nucleic acid-binding protein
MIGWMTYMQLIEQGRYLFDTSVFIDYLRQKPVAQTIFQQIPAKQIHVGYSIVTEAELWVGINALHPAHVHEKLLLPLARYDLDVAIARRAGELKAIVQAQRYQSVPSIVDCIIAATGEYYGLRVCSRNTRHFRLFAALGITVDEYSL